MARKKVKLAWIANDAACLARFKKRRQGLMKKAFELSTLCDVKACAILYAPGEPQPEAWPSPEAAERVVARFRSMPEMEQSRKMMDQEGFLRQRAAKLEEQLRKRQRENRELETAAITHEALSGRRSMQDVGIAEATSLALMVEARLKAVQERIAMAKGQQQQEKKKTAVVEEAEMEALHRQDWMPEMMTMMRSPLDDEIHHSLVYGGEVEEMMMISGNTSNYQWLDYSSYPYFPLL